MEFRLTYEGPLVSTRGNPEPHQSDKRGDAKHRLRKHFRDQLEHLWNTHPALKLRKSIQKPRGFGSYQLQRVANKDVGADEIEGSWFREIVDAHTWHDWKWMPLVREDDLCECSIDVLYLRNGARGHFLSDADIDNRIKTVIDALKLPKPNHLPRDIQPEPHEDPFYILLQDDSLVTRLTVETDVLLSPTGKVPEGDDTDSRIIISVKVWPYATTHLNLAFL
ncbi:MAG: hypothetical protein ACRBEQ_13685 [Hyphomonas sp.]